MNQIVLSCFVLKCFIKQILRFGFEFKLNFWALPNGSAQPYRLNQNLAELLGRSNQPRQSAFASFLSSHPSPATLIVVTVAR
jgi:hypothetical protein